MPLVAEKQTASAPPSLDRLKRFFELSLEMADISEALIEDSGAYSQEFIAGLQRSLVEQKKGQLRKIDALSELRRA